MRVTERCRCRNPTKCRATVDTAEIYGGYRVEAFLGEVLRQNPNLRSRIEIVSKALVDLVPSERCRRHTTVDEHARLNGRWRRQHDGRPPGDGGGKFPLVPGFSGVTQGVLHKWELFLVHRPDQALTAVEDTAEGLDRLLRAGGKSERRAFLITPLASLRR